MKKYYFLFFSIFLLQTPVFSQAAIDVKSSKTDEGINSADVLALQRSYLQLTQQKVVLDNLQLTPQESDAFWPVFRSYQNEFELIGDRIVSLILSFTEKYDSITDDEALKMLKEAQSIQQAETELKRSYSEKFLQVLPPKKALRFYQIDNKIRTELRYFLSLEIPLLVAEEL